jgi:DNA mismatch endonuclease, patch repair protein
MVANRSKDTKPEMTVRSLLHRMGYRFRLHRRDLPGKPDLVFPARKKVVEVRGCFWHGHRCGLGQLPRSRRQYWVPKIEANRSRDLANMSALHASGWEVLEIWECEVREGGPGLMERLVGFLGSATRGRSEDRPG